VYPESMAIDNAIADYRASLEARVKAAGRVGQGE
jgi:hypothetical protein